MKLIPILLLVALILSGCSSTGWLVEDRQQSPKIYLEDINPDVIPQNERRLDNRFWDPFVSSHADSLSHSALLRFVTGVTRSQQQGPSITPEIVDADYILRVDNLEISRVFTMNFVHPGPVFRIKVEVSAWQGNRKVFETRQTTTSNLAVTAADGARFYYPDRAERTDLNNLRNTIYPAVVSAFGRAWQEFLLQ